ncbi:MAG: DUF4175 domain-containing protein [Desulfobacterales bacterium]|nr:DUF4175 domain-containing protein [Desulfobacterales bacterium]
MRKLKVVLFITLGLICFSATAYAAWQIQYTGEAARMFGSTPRGNFATEDQCRDYWRSQPAFEQNNSKCVGYDEPSRQTQQDSGRGGFSFRDNNARQRQQELREEAEHQQMIRQQKLREQQARAEFERGKKEMLTQLKGGSGGEELSLKGSGIGLALKPGNTPAKNQGSTSEDQLQQAEQRLSELRDDVKAMQFALQLYRDALLRNVTSMDRQAREIGNMSDKILIDGIKYFYSIGPSRFLKSKFKFLSKHQQKKYEEFIELIEEIKDKKEFLSWLVNSPNDIKKLIAGADMLADDTIPGWGHVKMNFKAWSSAGKQCVAWLEINRIDRGTENYALEIKAISLRMKRTVAEINCMKRCMAESTDGCIQKCS